MAVSFGTAAHALGAAWEPVGTAIAGHADDLARNLAGTSTEEFVTLARAAADDSARLIAEAKVATAHLDDPVMQSLVPMLDETIASVRAAANHVENGDPVAQTIGRVSAYTGMLDASGASSLIAQPLGTARNSGAIAAHVKRTSSILAGAEATPSGAAVASGDAIRQLAQARNLAVKTDAGLEVLQSIDTAMGATANEVGNIVNGGTPRYLSESVLDPTAARIAATT